jgi:hypothetical protein
VRRFNYLSKNGVHYSFSQYSINKGLWGQAWRKRNLNVKPTIAMPTLQLKKKEKKKVTLQFERRIG